MTRAGRFQRGGRSIGAAAGFGVCALCLVLDALFDSVASGNATLPTLARPVLVAGVVGGWLIGPRAMRARTQRDWVGAMWRLAAVAVVLGDLVVCTQIATSGTHATGEGEVIDVAELVSASLVLAVIGLVLLGWFALIVTSVAAGIWAISIRVIRGPLGPQVSGSAIHSPSAAPRATNTG